jgi:hypothetical protein
VPLVSRDALAAPPAGGAAGMSVMVEGGVLGGVLLGLGCSLQAMRRRRGARGGR